MKKMSLVAVALVVVAGIAFASSMGIPWFVDNSAANVGYPPSSGTSAFIQLKNNNTEEAVTCWITYFAADGTNLGPAYPDNEFSIPAGASVAFRPVASDPIESLGGGANGQENAVAMAIPNRPTDVIPGKNGSAIIEFEGGPTDLQGALIQLGLSGTFQSSFAYLLPPGN